MVKGILVIIDGLGDLPCKQLGGKTPLEQAKKDNLNYLASHGGIGELIPVKEGVIPESDSAILSILGNHFYSSYRGQLEAIGAGIKLEEGDLAIRTNFGTIENLQSKKVIDRRAGRTLTTKEAGILADAINAGVKLPCKFIFKNTVQHRGVLVLKGGFTDNVSNTDPAYHSSGNAISPEFKFSRPLDEDENSKYAANMINSFIEQSNKILEEHVVNKQRVKKGLMPANILFTRDASVDLPQLNQLKRWACVTPMPLEIGIAKSSGMETFSFPYPEMKDFDVYQNLFDGLDETIKFAIKTLEKKEKEFSYFYLHFKETDVPGHDNKPNEKKEMIEILDKDFFSFLKKFAEKNKIKVIVTGDHSTPCNLKAHSADPVPILICDWTQNNKKEFCEKTGKTGELGRVYGKDVIRLMG